MVRPLHIKSESRKDGKWRVVVECPYYNCDHEEKGEDKTKYNAQTRARMNMKRKHMDKKHPGHTYR